MESWGSMRKNIKQIAGYIILLLLCLCAVFIGAKVWGGYTYMLEKTYADDFSTFAAVGNGILHGDKPYINLSEEKPPVIFYLCAASIKLFGDLTLITILSFISYLVILFVPAYLAFRYSKIKKNLVKAVITLSVFIFTLAIESFMFWSVAAGIPELFGTLFCILNIWILVKLKEKSFEWHWGNVVVSAVLICLACMTKEPFLIILIASSLVFFENTKKYWLAMICSYALGGLIIILFLTCLGLLPAYFSIYLPYLMSSRIGGASGLTSGLKFGNIFGRIKEFSPFFLGSIVGIYLLGGFIVAKNTKAGLVKKIVIGIAVTFFVVYFSVYSIMVGNAYAQHYLFIIAVIVSFVVFIATRKAINKIDTVCLCLLVLLSVSSTMGVQPHKSRGVLSQTSIEGKQARAAYADEILSRLGYDEFVYLSPCNHDKVFYEFTKTSKVTGPWFYQYHRHGYDLKSREQIKIMIEQTNVIFVEDHIEIPNNKELLEERLSREFRKVSYEEEFPDLTLPENMEKIEMFVIDIVRN